MLAKKYLWDLWITKRACKSIIILTVSLLYPAKATKNVISLGLNWLHIALAIFVKLYGLVIKGMEEVG